MTGKADDAAFIVGTSNGRLLNGADDD